MAETPNEHSGSRWEPESSDQVTEDLTPAGEQPTEVIPGLTDEPAPVPAAPKRRIPKAAAAVAIVAAAVIGGGAVGLALAGNRSQPVSDTAVTSGPNAGTQDQGTDGGTGTAPDGGTGTAPRFGDGDGRGYDADGDGEGGFGHHGPGGH